MKIGDGSCGTVPIVARDLFSSGQKNHPRVRKLILKESAYPAKAIDVIGQICAIVILLDRGKDIIRFCAPVDIVESAVLHEGFTLVGRDPERSSPGGGCRQHCAGSAGGSAAKQRHFARRLEGAGYIVAVGEAGGRGQAEQVIARHGVRLVKDTVKVYIGPIGRGAHCACHGVNEAGCSLAEHPGNNKRRDIITSARVCAHFENHVAELGSQDLRLSRRLD